MRIFWGAVAVGLIEGVIAFIAGWFQGLFVMYGIIILGIAICLGYDHYTANHPKANGNDKPGDPED